MKAQYENNSEYSVIYLQIKNDSEFEKAMAIAEKLIKWGDYSMSHYDSELVMLTCTDNNKTISNMKEDYREAKKAI